MAQLPIEMLGRRFGRLLVLEHAAPTWQGYRRWLCRCDCGTTKVILGAALRAGDTQSCGCKRRHDKPPSQPQPPRLGNLLFGYRWDGTTIVSDEQTAEAIRQIDVLYQQGRPIRAIVEALNAGPPRTDGKPWDSNRIFRIVQNLHLYRGGRCGKQAATWPAILAPLKD